MIYRDQLCGPRGRGGGKGRGRGQYGKVNYGGFSTGLVWFGKIWELQYRSRRGWGYRVGLVKYGGSSRYG